MDPVERVAPDPPEKARPARRFPPLPALGVLLVAVGVIMSFTGFGAGWEAGMDGQAAPLWAMPALFLGLAAVLVGAVILVWRAAVRFRPHGVLASVLAGIGGLGLAFLLVAAVFVILALLTAQPPSS